MVRSKQCVGMQIGRKKADFRIKVIHKTGKSKAFPVYNSGLTLEQIVKKLIDCLQENKK